ncbi:hypothetical protein R1sor_023341 [Riccia sorocarpa]|uniref:Uncharacterized protein n=1 Tax=Riccia sorocarpa TaxID=122646 RepID=A0ABD3GMC7_9MARC
MASSSQRRILRRPRRETNASRYAIDETEDDVVIRQRLLTKTVTMTRNADPPLNKLVQKFLALSAEVQKDEGNHEDIKKLHDAFLEELDTFYLPLTRSKLVVDLKKREQENFKMLHADLKAQLSQAKVEVPELKLQLEEERFSRKPEKESEAIRRLILAFPSRSEAQEKSKEIQKELDLLEREDAAVAASVECRKGILAYLLHAVDDLGNIGANPVESASVSSTSDDFKLMGDAGERAEEHVDNDNMSCSGLPDH